MFHVRREGAQAGKRLLNFPKKPRASERERILSGFGSLPPPPLWCPTLMNTAAGNADFTNQGNSDGTRHLPGQPETGIKEKKAM